ncbi:MAG TPA: hypothetical protein VGL83_17395 [Stellaceae bacterium]
MPKYIGYFVNAAGHIVDFVRLSCASDGEAQVQAVALLDERRQYAGILVWDGTRQILELSSRKA